MAKITINSKTIFVEGNVQIKDELLYINGDLFLSLKKFSEDEIIITIDGDLESFTVDVCYSLRVYGNIPRFKLDDITPKTSNDQGLSFGDENPFFSENFTGKYIYITINGDVGRLIVDTFNELAVLSDDLFIAVGG